MIDVRLELRHSAPDLGALQNNLLAWILDGMARGLFHGFDLHVLDRSALTDIYLAGDGAEPGPKRPAALTPSSVVPLDPKNPSVPQGGSDPWNDPVLADAIGKGHAALAHLVTGWRVGFGDPDARQPDRQRLLADVRGNFPDIRVYVLNVRLAPSLPGGLITATAAILFAELGGGKATTAEGDQAIRDQAVQIASNVVQLSSFMPPSYKDLLEPWDADALRAFVQHGTPYPQLQR